MDNKQDKRTDEILNSLDGLAKAAAPDFFYTRLRARMEAGAESPSAQQSWLLRPAYAVATLVIVLLVNSFVLLQKNRPVAGTGTGNDPDATVQSIAAEYNLGDNSALYDLTQDK
jgi:hypothetical protein